MIRVKQQSQTLALLLGLPHEGATAMHNDVRAMYNALRMRGLEPEQILCFEGKFDRKLLLELFTSVRRLLKQRGADQLFLYVSGNGYFNIDSPYERGIGIALQPASQMTKDGYVFWEELFQKLTIPQSVQITLLPDHCYTNLLVGRIPANVSALVMKTEPEDSLVCQTQNHDFDYEGKVISFGVLSYYAMLTMPHVPDLCSWLQQIESHMNAALATGGIRLFASPRFQILGNPNQLLPGLMVTS